MNFKRAAKYFIATSVVSIIFSLILIETPLFQKINFALLDYKFHLSPKADSLWSDKIVIIEIDQETLDYFDINGIGWPFPRLFYAEVLRYVSKNGAAAVFFDIDFSSPETERLEISSKESEEKFYNAVKEFDNCILAALIKSSSHLDQQYWQSNQKIKDTIHYVEALLPYGKLSQSALAVVNVYPDLDGIIRNLVFKFQVGDRVFYTPSIEILREIKKISYSQIDSLIEGVYKIKNNTIEINWANIKDYKNQFVRISFYKVLRDSYSGRNELANLFNDKIVFVGGAALGLMDFKPTPISKSEPIPGVYIHIGGLLTLLNQNYLKRAEKYQELLFFAIMMILGALIFHFLPGVFWSILVVILLTVVYAIISFEFFIRYSIALCDLLPFLGSFFLISVGSFNKYYFEFREKKIIKRIFSRYLNPIVVEQLIQDPEKIELEGKNYDVAIFFSDIKNFTSIAEKYSAKEVVKFLNEYFQLCSDIMLKYDAMIDKYIGDSIMALFGAPLEDKNKSIKACIAALEIQEQLKLFNRLNGEKNKPIFETRIGINSGEAVIGNLGAAFHLDYTAIGDSVNLASRLEGLNKLYGTKIIISESVFNEAKEQIEVRELDLIQVKGKEIPIKVYELLGKKGSLSESEITHRDIFEIGLALYRIKDFERAKKQFEKALEIKKDDMASKLYIQRCINLSKQKLPENWNGIFIAEEKY